MVKLCKCAGAGFMEEGRWRRGGVGEGGGFREADQGGGCSERALQRLSGRTGCAGSGLANDGREPRTVVNFICKVGL